MHHQKMLKMIWSCVILTQDVALPAARAGPGDTRGARRSGALVAHAGGAGGRPGRTGGPGAVCRAAAGRTAQGMSPRTTYWGTWWC